MKTASLVLAVLRACGVAAAEAREWRILVLRELAELAYPAANGGDGAIRLECERGGGEIRVSTPAGAARATDGAVSSGGAAELVRIAYDRDAADLSVVLPIDSPVWDAFEATGALAMKVADVTIAPPPAAPAQARRFISACFARAPNNLP